MSNVSSTGSDTRAVWVYMGKMLATVTARYVGVYIATNGTGSPICEVGLFSTTSAPNGAGQTLTKIVSGVTASVTSGSSNRAVRNASIWSQSVPANTYLWAGYRIADNGGTRPAILQCIGDGGRAGTLYQNVANAFSVSTSWGSAIPISGNLTFPNEGFYMWVEV